MFSILLHEFYQREKSCALHSSEDYKFLSPLIVTQDINSAKSLTVEVSGLSLTCARQVTSSSRCRSKRSRAVTQQQKTQTQHLQSVRTDGTEKHIAYIHFKLAANDITAPIPK